MYDQGMGAAQIAGLLRVSTKSVYHWRRTWRQGARCGTGLEEPGGNACKLDGYRLTRLRGRWVQGRPLTASGTSGGLWGVSRP